MKRILAVMLTLVLAVSLAGCGNNGQTVQSAPMPAAAEDTSIATPSAEAVATSSSAVPAASGGVLLAEGVTVVLPVGASTEGWQNGADSPGVYILPFSLDGAACELYLRRSDGVDLSMAGPDYDVELPVGAEIDPYETHYSFHEYRSERSGAVFWARDGFAFALTMPDCTTEAALEELRNVVDAGIAVEAP